MIPLIKKCSDKKLLLKIGRLIESRKEELNKIEANKYFKEIFESFPSKKRAILATIKKDSKAFDGISVSYCSNFPNEYTECSRSEVLVMNDLVGNKKLSNLFEKVYTHLSVKATIGQQRQQEISLNEAFEEFCKNKFFTIMLATGSYRYTEGYFVLNDEKYYDANTNSMTQYAKSHLAECTIDFSYRYVRKDQGDHIGSHMFHKNVEYKRIPSFDVSAQNTDSYNHARALENIRKKFDEEYELESKIHESTTQKFWKIMQLKKWNTSIFQDKTWLSPMDYTRVQDPKHIFKLPAYTAMAVGLGLSLSITEEILRASGLAYNMGDRTHKAYAFVLSSFQGCSLEECNEVLKALGVKELGTKSRK